MVVTKFGMAVTKFGIAVTKFVDGKLKVLYLWIQCMSPVRNYKGDKNHTTSMFMNYPVDYNNTEQLYTHLPSFKLS